MSLVIYKDGVMAADSGSWWGNMIHATRAIKVKCLNKKRWTKGLPAEGGKWVSEKLLVGCVGGDEESEIFFRICDDRGNFEDIKKAIEHEDRLTAADFSAMIVRETDPSTVYFVSKGIVFAADPGTTAFVLGAAAEFARGCLAAECTVIESLQLACRHTNCALGPVVVASFKDPHPTVPLFAVKPELAAS